MMFGNGFVRFDIIEMLSLLNSWYSKDGKSKINDKPGKY